MSKRSDIVQSSNEVCEVRHLHPARIAELRRDLVPDGAAGRLAETFRVLGDPTRVRMLDALSRGELCVCDLAGLIRLSESAVSHQLRLMRTLRLVRARREGRMVYYVLDDRHIMALLQQGLRHVKEEAPAAPVPVAVRIAAGRPAGRETPTASPAHSAKATVKGSLR